MSKTSTGQQLYSKETPRDIILVSYVEEVPFSLFAFGNRTVKIFCFAFFVLAQKFVSVMIFAVITASNILLLNKLLTGVLLNRC